MKHKLEKSGQELTKSAYEDPTVVEGYITRNALDPKNAGIIHTFSKTITFLLARTRKMAHV